MSNISSVALASTVPYFRNYGTAGDVNCESQNSALSSSTITTNQATSYQIHSSTHHQVSQWMSNNQMEPYQFIPRQFEQYQSASSSLPQDSFQYYNAQQDHQSQEQYQQPQQYYHSPPSHQLPILTPPIYQAPPPIIQEVSCFVLFLFGRNSSPVLVQCLLTFYPSFIGRTSRLWSSKAIHF